MVMVMNELVMVMNGMVQKFHEQQYHAAVQCLSTLVLCLNTCRENAIAVAAKIELWKTSLFS